jgi:hypothetical protein
MCGGTFECVQAGGLDLDLRRKGTSEQRFSDGASAVVPLTENQD